MTKPDQDHREKPHSIWPGVAILGFLLLLVLGGLLSGGVNAWAALAFLGVAVLVAAAAILAALAASLIRDARRVVIAARALCVLFVAGTGLSGYLAGVYCCGFEASAEAFWGVLVVSSIVGGTLAPFVAAYAVYRHARRSGKSHQEAQALSRWDPKRFGMK